MQAITFHTIFGPKFLYWQFTQQPIELIVLNFLTRLAGLRLTLRLHLCPLLKQKIQTVYTAEQYHYSAMVLCICITFLFIIYNLGHMQHCFCCLPVFHYHGNEWLPLSVTPLPSSHSSQDISDSQSFYIALVFTDSSMGEMSSPQSPVTPYAFTARSKQLQYILLTTWSTTTSWKYTVIRACAVCSFA